LKRVAPTDRASLGLCNTHNRVFLVKLGVIKSLQDEWKFMTKI
jgi:hypothetical protein